MSIFQQVNEMAKSTARVTHIQPYMYQTKAEIEAWMKKARIEGMVNREMEIEVAESSTIIDRFGTPKEDILIEVKGKWVLPVQFKLSGRFDLGHIDIDSFVGSPLVVMGDFNANSIKTDTMKGSPKLVTGKITIMFRNSHLKNLEDFPQISGNGAEVQLGMRRSLENSTLDSLEGISSDVTELSIGLNFYNTREIVQYCPKLTGLWMMAEPDFSKNPAYLNVFKLKHLQNLFIGPERVKDEDRDYIRATDIMLKHLKGERDMLDCKEELIENGLKDFAKTA